MSIFLCQLPQNTQLRIILPTYLPSFSSSILSSLFKIPVSYQAGVKGSKAEVRFKRHSDLRGSYRNPVSRTTHEQSVAPFGGGNYFLLLYLLRGF